MYETQNWLDSEKEHALYSTEKSATPAPVYKVTIIGGLYFPEIKLEVFEFKKAVMDYQTWTVKSRANIAPLFFEKDADSYKEAVETALAEYKSVYQQLVEATSSIEGKAAKLMTEVLCISC